MTRRATICCVGDELLAGELADANGPHFAARLAELGFKVGEIRVLPDELEPLAAAVRAELERVDLVLVCGGLGPTSDDRTTEAVARALGAALETNEVAWEQIRALFQAARGIEPPPGNEKQALIPVGATLLPNDRGTAPGYLAAGGDARVAVLPGPPRENQRMFERQLLPALHAAFPGLPRRVTRVCRVFGLPESVVGQRLAALEARGELRVGYQFRFPEIMVKLRAEPGQEGLLDEAEATVREQLAPHVYGVGDAELPEVVGRAAAARGMTIVAAESCTAGLVTKLLTDAAGSSAWVERGFVTYSNAAKVEALGVEAGLIAEHGAVSEVVAEAMLAGALARSAADVGVAITGISGPDGGTAEKPVGTTCIAWGSREAREVKTYRFRWNRAYNRTVAAWTALARLYRFLLDG